MLIFKTFKQYFNFFSRKISAISYKISTENPVLQNSFGSGCLSYLLIQKMGKIIIPNHIRQNRKNLSNIERMTRITYILQQAFSLFFALNISSSFNISTWFANIFRTERNVGILRSYLKVRAFISVEEIQNVRSLWLVLPKKFLCHFWYQSRFVEKHKFAVFYICSI